ncbi:hypothetical protein GCM10027053_12960 [Intrasporangium mesophilum]
MIAVVRMTGFHAQRFWSTPFFVQVLMFSTTQVVCLQALANHAGVGASPHGWIRAALTGVWTVSTVSAGIIGFQRFQGTLVHLVRSPRPAWQSVTPVVAAVSTFGLFSVPVSLVLSILLGLPVEGVTDGRLLVGVGMFWLGSLTMATLMATLFVLSRYATTYEALIGNPLVLLSDVFGHPPAWTWFDIASAWLPTAWAVRLVFDPGTGLGESTGWFVFTVVLWAVASAVLGRAVLRRATRHGTLEVV